MGETKLCAKCGETKDKATCFSYSAKHGVQSYCVECRKKLNQEKLNDPIQRQKLYESINRNRRELRKATIEAYGNKCACCGETEFVFLTIDHVFNDGAQERAMLKNSSATFYRKLRREGYPKDRYQCLCYNCNCAKRILGYCPHRPPEKSHQQH